MDPAHMEQGLLLITRVRVVLNLAVGQIDL